MESISELSVTASGMSSDDLFDDDAFCDIIESQSDDFYSMNNTGLPYDQNDTEVSEDVLREEIEKVDKLRLDEVRWFYCTKKKNKWKPLLGKDSINLEREWRRCEYQKLNKQYSQRVCVRGGMYEVDVMERKCYPVYWTCADSSKPDAISWIPVLRGTWFFEGYWQPLDEDLATRIEQDHYERWKGYDIEQIKELINNKVMHSVQLDGCHVEWNSVTDVIFYKDATTHRAFRNIVTKFGVSKATSTGYRLHRGYKEDAMEEENLPSIKNLVFVVHGIGAKSDRSRIVRNTGEFRSTCRRLKLKNLDGRSEFIPVEWRSRLKLDGDIVETITPKKAQGMRKFLNNTAMDVMYYASPLYRNEIVNGLCDELNRIYQLFMIKNPKFDGKINVMAHSLGNVIFHDVLTHWQLDIPLAENQANVNVRASEDPRVRLNFQTDTLFCVGSPLGVFLCLKGFSPEDGTGTQDDIVPSSVCRRIFNIFHPADPVAYRLEPLIFPRYANISPVQISSYSVIMKAKQEQQAIKLPLNDEASPECNNQDQHEKGELREGENSTETSATDSPTLHRQSSYLRSVAGGAVRLGRGVWSRVKGNSQNPAAFKEDESLLEAPDTAAVEDIDEDLNLPRLEERIDHELQEGFTESKLGYASLTSHTSYWSNQDVAMFIMSKLYA